MEDLQNNTPPYITAPSVSATSDTLLQKTRDKYDTCYQRFMDYREQNQIHSFSEGVLLGYISHLSQTYTRSTLWATYSMLRSTLLVKHDTDISKYFRLKAYLKKENVGVMTKKASVFSQTEIEKFITQAPDKTYLLTKVAAVIAISGACRRDELTNLSINDVEEIGSKLLIKIPKANKPRSFLVREKYFPICQKYMALRPERFSDRFFFTVRKGKGVRLPIGIKTFGKMPQRIAEYLNLPQPESYTGQSFRQSSSKIFVDNCGDICALKRREGMMSTSVAEGYIDKPLNIKIEAGDMLFSNPQISTTSVAEGYMDKSLNIKVEDEDMLFSDHQVSTTDRTNLQTDIINVNTPKQSLIYNFSNCVVNIYNYNKPSE